MNKDNSIRHVAIIMDGNGRWAKKRKLPRVQGHNAGMKSMTEIVRKASDMGLEHLTVYAFSTENWKRSAEEVKGIFGLLIKYVNLELAELAKENVKVTALGDISQIPPRSLASLKKALAKTENNTGLQFNIAINYGGRMDIVRAVNKYIEEHPGQPLSEEDIAENLYTGKENGNIPDPDLIIRTSGEERISNFLTWQSAYSELAFTDTLWPDFKPKEFEMIIDEYKTRERRFGGRNE